MFTKEHAKLIIEAHDVMSFTDNEEEADLLEKHNPALLEAYLAILDFAGE